MQCSRSCTEHIWEADRFVPEINEEHCLLKSALPKCIFCREVARPNILMFNDFNWLANRKYEQQMRFRNWRSHVSNPVVIEIGAGTAIPSVRMFGQGQGVPLIRINPRESGVTGEMDIAIPAGALDGLCAIQECL